jgi:hypothetical protein
MWRSLFLALGIFAVVLGVECLLIDRATLITSREVATAQVSEFNPPDWAPWSLLSGGAVVILYSFTLPRRYGNG